MPAKIILGTEGTQLFKITNNCVSRRHACISISDSGKWYIEDLDSRNGTFIRLENTTKLIKIGQGQFQISPMTYVSLGPDNAQGCRFYARQALKQNYGDYSEEYALLRTVNDQYKAKLEKIENNAKLVKWGGLGINLLIFSSSFWIPESILPQNGMFNFVRFGMLLSSVPVLLYDSTSAKKKLEEKRKILCKCPNPNCNNILKPDDIYNLVCPKCKKNGIQNINNTK